MENMRTDVREKSVKEKKNCTKETFHGHIFVINKIIKCF